LDKEYFSVADFYTGSREALSLASEYIRNVILGNENVGEYIEKGDKTLVTKVDLKSQELATPIIRHYFPNFGLNQEEAENELGDISSRYKLYHDPLDGTGGFLIGGCTPTVILGLYDTLLNEWVAVSTMEPISGRFWFSSKNEGAYVNVFDYSKESWVYDEGKQIYVNNQSLDGGLVLVDVGFGFNRSLDDGTNKLVLDQEGRRRLSTNIEEKGAKEMSFCTNGGHYALVANGNPVLAGNITTAIGGPYDIAGVLHVKEAGGYIGALLIKNEERRMERLENPQDIRNADIVVASNSEDNLEKLIEGIVDCLNP